MLKYPIAIAPGLYNNGATATATAIDRLSFTDFALFLLTMGVSDIALATVKVQESDDDGVLDAYADIAGAEITGSDLPQSNDDAKTWGILIDLKNARKRYLKLVVVVDGNTGTTGANLSAICVLDGAVETPKNASTMGLELLVRVPDDEA